MRMTASPVGSAAAAGSPMAASDGARSPNDAAPPGGPTPHANSPRLNAAILEETPAENATLLRRRLILPAPAADVHVVTLTARNGAVLRGGYVLNENYFCKLVGNCINVAKIFFGPVAKGGLELQLHKDLRRGRGLSAETPLFAHVIKMGLDPSGSFGALVNPFIRAQDVGQEFVDVYGADSIVCLDEDCRAWRDGIYVPLDHIEEEIAEPGIVRTCAACYNPDTGKFKQLPPHFFQAMEASFLNITGRLDRHFSLDAAREEGEVTGHKYATAAARAQGVEEGRREKEAELKAARELAAELKKGYDATLKDKNELFDKQGQQLAEAREVAARAEQQAVQHGGRETALRAGEEGVRNWQAALRAGQESLAQDKDKVAAQREKEQKKGKAHLATLEGRLLTAAMMDPPEADHVWETALVHSEASQNASVRSCGFCKSEVRGSGKHDMGVLWACDTHHSRGRARADAFLAEPQVAVEAGKGDVATQ